MDDEARAPVMAEQKPLLPIFDLSHFHAPAEQREAFLDALGEVLPEHGFF